MSVFTTKTCSGQIPGDIQTSTTFWKAMTIVFFFAINKLKEKYNNQPIWEDPVGHIYEEVKSCNYVSEGELEESVNFFDGDLVNASISKNIIQYANEHGFRRIDELITSMSGGFASHEDYIEAKEFRIPNNQTLRSYRLVEELLDHFDFKNRTEALLFAVLLKLRKEAVEGAESGRMMVGLYLNTFSILLSRTYRPKS